MLPPRPDFQRLPIVLLDGLWSFRLDARDPIVLRQSSRELLLLARIRDEAHRFAITYHRKERGRIKSRLDSVPGVGPVKRKALLRRFGSVEGVRRASVEEIGAVQGIGPELGRVIAESLRETES